MKFHDIAIGQRFESDGTAYLKTSPMIASPEGGGPSRFMARYAQVKPLDGGERPAKAAGDTLLRADDVLAAFEVFYGCCTQQLARCEQPETRTAIKAGRDDFLAALSRQGNSK